MQHYTHTFICYYAYWYIMESTDLERTASEIESSVDDLKTEVLYMREALQKLLEAAQEGIDQLDDL